MKSLFSVLVSLCIAAFAIAQPVSEGGLPKRTPEELEKLVAPIALYPDALIALILPASTNTSDLVLAARSLPSNPSPSEIDAQPWDESVKSLSRYPEVLRWMDENLTWTRELGEAFAAQPADVMNTVQKLRADARAKGLLQDTAQQKVVVRESEICIVPADPEVIYVPSYDPDVLVYNRPYSDSWLTFSVGFATGSWLFYDCDWSSRSVWVYRRPVGWAYRPDWRWHERGERVHVHEQWRPSPNYWEHAHMSRGRSYRPIPRVEPPHFGPHAGGDRNYGQNRVWEGRPDDGQRTWTTNRDGRPVDRNNDRWQQRSRDDHSGTQSGVNQNPRIRNQTTAPIASQPSGVSAVAPNPPVSNPAVAAPAPNPTPSRTWQPGQNPDRRRRQDGESGGERHFSREINNPARQRTDVPAAVRLQPPAPAPAPMPVERVGRVSPRESGQPVYRHPDVVQRPVAAPPPPAAVPQVQHSAPPPPPPPPAPTSAAAPAPPSSGSHSVREYGRNADGTRADGSSDRRNRN